MKSNIIVEKSFQFALQMIELNFRLKENKEYDISRQLLRSGTSIGANIEEAIAGSSKRDFIAKMHIARKEARETNYWLRLIKESTFLNVDVSGELANSTELIKLLTSIIKTSQSSMN